MSITKLIGIVLLLVSVNVRFQEAYWVERAGIKRFDTVSPSQGEGIRMKPCRFRDRVPPKRKGLKTDTPKAVSILVAVDLGRDSDDGDFTGAGSVGNTGAPSDDPGS